jgi:hypothetical protein
MKHATHATPAALFSVCSNCELDGKIIANPAAHGFALDSYGLWCKGKYDTADKLVRFRALWVSVDSYGKPSTRNFKSPAAMLKFAEEEQFLNEGRVSDDGVTRFLGFQGNPFPNGAPNCWREIRLSALRPA